MTQVEKTNRVQREKDSDKMHLKRLLVMVCLCAAAGGVIGFFLMFARDWISENIGIKDEAIQSYLGLISLAVYVAGTIFLFVMAFFQYSRAKKLAVSWNGEDEAVMDAIEKKQNLAMLWNNMLMIFFFLFFALVIGVSGIFELARTIETGIPELSMFRIIAFFGSVPTLFMGVILYMVIYKCVFDLQKKLNPEKQGSVYDFQFDKKWEESCDEAQKQMMYKAGYKAFRAGNMTCLGFWLISIFGLGFFQTGVFPVVCICAIWLALNISYSRSVIQRERHK